MRTLLNHPAALRATLVAAMLFLAVPADAQEPRPWCFAGRPLPACTSFLVATLNYFPGQDAQSESAVTWSLVEWEMGWLTNRGAESAAGWTAAVGTSATGFHLSGKRRYRLWLTRGLAVDGSVGLMIAQHPPNGYPHANVVGPTADVTLGLTDWAAISARGHVLLGPETSTRVDVGVRLGTVPGLILGLGSAVILLGEAVGGA